MLKKINYNVERLEEMRRDIVVNESKCECV